MVINRGIAGSRPGNKRAIRSDKKPTRTLRLECAGKSERSKGHYLGIESVRLRERRPRVAEMGHDRDKDWKAEPTLYR